MSSAVRRTGPGSRTENLRAVSAKLDAAEAAIALARAELEQYQRTLPLLGVPPQVVAALAALVAYVPLLATSTEDGVL